ncbi:unnamed protein product [Orchesella dallaii]|uniref:C2H2-type domain-containing protein n=1 Tax=Orchesella dallaii TaxID=48710 RepID=A0ABP1RC02_9HEXA
MADDKASGVEGSSSSSEPVSSEMDVDPEPVAKTDDTNLSTVTLKGEMTDSVSEKEENNVKEVSNSDDKVTLEELETDETEQDIGNDNDDGIVILDEDDGTENENTEFETASGSPSKVPDEPLTDVKPTVNIKKEKDNIVPEKIDGDGDEEILVINPLFDKTSVSVNSNTVPVYDIDSSSSEDGEPGEDGQEDFSADIGLENLEEEHPVTGNWANIGAQQIGQSCGVECYQEKGILVNEIERLRKAIFVLGERHSVIEDFIEVEYGDKFDKYLKNREHLMKMGFGVKEPDSVSASDVIDGKRSSKSSELVELLKMIKEQAETNGANDDKSSTGSGSQGKTVSSGGSKKQNKSPPNANRQQQNPKQTDRPKPIQNIGKRNDHGRGGAMSYQQGYSTMQPEMLSRHPVLLQQQQYRQQQLMGPPQAPSAQSQYYYDSMYSNYTGSTVTRDVVSLVGRKDLYPQNSYGYGGGGYSSRKTDGASSSYSLSSATGSEEKGSRRSRKRKPLIPQSSSSGKPQQNSTAANQGSVANKADSNANKNQEASLASKRICPLCFKIISRRYLRDHLIVHQGLQISCPVCKEGFFMRRRLKLHLRDDHKLTMEDCIPYLEKAISTTETEIGIANLNGMMERAAIPTKQQVLEQNNASDSDVSNTQPQPTRTGVQSGTGGGGSSGAAKGKGKQQQKPLLFKGQNQQQSRGRGRHEATDLYGPGGYAQYAARYLQQQRGGSGAAPVARLFTPF